MSIHSEESQLPLPTLEAIVSIRQTERLLEQIASSLYTAEHALLSAYEDLDKLSRAIGGYIDGE